MKSYRKSKHTVDLARLHAVWSSNYAAVLELLPGFRESLPSEPVCVTSARALQVQVIERGSHTVVLDITQLPFRAEAPDPDGHHALKVQRLAGHHHFRLRVYHDARMAEVIASHGHRYLRPHYDYPNRQMYHQDEKLQLNCHFGDWLKYYLSQREPAPAINDFPPG